MCKAYKMWLTHTQTNYDHKHLVTIIILNGTLDITAMIYITSVVDKLKGIYKVGQRTSH